ncbi:hypothetical protein RJJ63_14980 [Rhizobium hidalgonense]|uniref:hypothetical protein n=1 Tax=Rhizobium hidalgonense TaxID=1538159 RepID=UPI0028725C08|nr:hypothetical protein [Rhizobium hidalgonense]MDR9820598.1 hypothetical protein [Rhizobium hidalgonense]
MFLLIGRHANLIGYFTPRRRCIPLFHVIAAPVELFQQLARARLLYGPRSNPDGVVFKRLVVSGRNLSAGIHNGRSRH